MLFRNLAPAVLVSLSLLVSGCSPKKAEKPRPRPPAPVVVGQATVQDVPVMIRTIGTMEASESIAIRTQISGQLVKVGFREGQDVQKGALLFRIDPRPYQAALQKAEATLARDRVVMENAKANYERYRGLVKEGIVTQEQAEGYRTQAESAAASVAADQAEVENARAQLSFCTIRSPISGRLGVLVVNQGNVVKANDTVLVTINKLTPISAIFTIPEKELTAIKQQLSSGKVIVEAEVPGAPGVVEKGIVSFMDNTVDITTGTLKLKAIFENRQKRLWPGQFVNIAIILSIRKNAVVVPAQAVQTGQQGQYVFVVKPDATAELRPVTAGIVNQGLTVIDKGLAGGEQVVVDGQVRVIPGGKVEIRTPGKSGSAAPATPEAAGTAKPEEKKSPVPPK